MTHIFVAVSGNEAKQPNWVVIRAAARKSESKAMGTYKPIFNVTQEKMHNALY